MLITISPPTLRKTLCWMCNSQDSALPGMVAVLDDLRMAADQGQFVALILLDLSDAVDTVNHKILLSRLTECGIQGTPLAWCKSYLEANHQSVSLAPFRSKSRVLLQGVPQGSSLSPHVVQRVPDPPDQVDPGTWAKIHELCRRHSTDRLGVSSSS